MKALSFLQPWLYAILELGKPVENRVWNCPAWMIDQPFLLHASKGYDRDGEEYIRSLGYDIPTEKEFGGGRPIPLSRSAIVGQAVITSAAKYDPGPDLFGEDRDPWSFGPWVWRLTNVERFADGAHGIKGALGFWNVDPYVTRRLFDQRTFPARRVEVRL